VTESTTLAAPGLIPTQAYRGGLQRVLAWARPLLCCRVVLRCAALRGAPLALLTVQPGELHKVTSSPDRFPSVRLPPSAFNLPTSVPTKIPSLPSCQTTRPHRLRLRLRQIGSSSTLLHHLTAPTSTKLAPLPLLRQWRFRWTTAGSQLARNFT
jgi:hypothetical protein